MRFVYFGLPLGFEALRRAGHVAQVACIGHLDMPGRDRIRRRCPGTLLLGKPDLDAPGIVRTLASLQPEALVSWFWPRRIPRAVLDLAPLAVGVHPSLLPRHRGPDPTFHAIRSGDRETGVTLHRLAPEYDTGDILAQRKIAIAPTDDAWRLAKKLDRPSLALLVECIDRLARGERYPQFEQDEALATAAPVPDEDDLAIDWTESAQHLERLVRAASPQPLASAQLGDTLVLVVRAELAPRPPSFEPGEALRDERGVIVACGDGALRLLEVEDEEGVRHTGAAIALLVPDAD